MGPTRYTELNTRISTQSSELRSNCETIGLQQNSPTSCSKFRIEKQQTYEVLISPRERTRIVSSVMNLAQLYPSFDHQ